MFSSEVQYGFSCAKVSRAVNAANVYSGAEFDFTEKTVNIAGTPIDQLVVTYKSGNEFLNLKVLCDRLGDVEVEEYRGRGHAGAIQLMFDVKYNGVRYQLIHIINDRKSWRRSRSDRETADASSRATKRELEFNSHADLSGVSVELQPGFQCPCSPGYFFIRARKKPHPISGKRGFGS